MKKGGGLEMKEGRKKEAMKGGKGVELGLLVAKEWWDVKK